MQKLTESNNGTQVTIKIQINVTHLHKTSQNIKFLENEQTLDERHFSQ